MTFLQNNYRFFLLSTRSMDTVHMENYSGWNLKCNIRSPSPLKCKTSIWSFVTFHSRNFYNNENRKYKERGEIFLLFFTQKNCSRQSHPSIIREWMRETLSFIPDSTRKIIFLFILNIAKNVCTDTLERICIIGISYISVLSSRRSMHLGLAGS